MRPDTIRQEAQKGNLPARKVGREWRFSKKAILRWLETRGPVPPFSDEPETVIRLDLMEALRDQVEHSKSSRKKS